MGVRMKLITEQGEQGKQGEKKTTCKDWGISLLHLSRKVCLQGAMLLLLPLSSSAMPNLKAEKIVNLGQTLPISAQAIVAGRTIGLEVARTSQQQAMGLMYRTALADDRGMLFPFEPPQPVKFWMKNTLIPLDMLFLQNGVVKAIAASVPPCTTSACSTYGPGVPVNQVIELRSGRAAVLGLKVGEQIKIKFLDSLHSRP